MNIDVFNKRLANICKENKFDVVYHRIDMATEEEYKIIRMHWFGASDSSKLLNISPFPNSTQMDLINEKLHNIVDDSIGKKASVRMGKDLEDLILEKSRPIIEKIVVEPCTILKPYDMYGSPECNNLGINYDAVCLGEESVFPIEIKTVTRYGRKHYDFSKAMTYQKDGDWVLTNFTPKPLINPNTEPKEKYEIQAESLGIPVYYYSQIQQQMIPLKSNFGLLVVLDVDNWDINIFYIPACQEIQEHLIEEARKAKEIMNIKKDLGVKS